MRCVCLAYEKAERVTPKGFIGVDHVGRWVTCFNWINKNACLNVKDSIQGGPLIRQH